ncbi:MAG TPA: hypothetical protein VMU07_00680 [Candidatus Paceibacterota bacterium]|nr:hypothetical protein [Candidatus Paceibacterota bacterium]
MDSKRTFRRGQAMLIAVLSLGGAMLGAIAIAGILLLYQVRASTNSASSARAVFAADTGINWTLFSIFCSTETIAGNPRCTAALPAPAPFLNGASDEITCYDAGNNSVDCFNNPAVKYAVSIGTSLGARRAFFVNLATASTTFP